jgi:subtilisin family serine protease
LHLNSKIKIAIIDSGVSKSDMKILGAMSKIQGRNFQRDAAHDKWDDDTHGHGTHISRLLLEIAPQADLYIAKVTNGHCMEQDVIGCITAAVNWTVQVWDVDIISLSLVVHEKNDSLKEALKQALDPQYDQSRRRIVFAAAGNTGGIRPMGWLASMPNVIAIHATDGFGNPAGFNPTSLEKFSFATLGQGQSRLHNPCFFDKQGHGFRADSPHSTWLSRTVSTCTSVLTTRL